ncbi:MAG: hypothetical protein PHS56_05960 [Eubacteriales bacterium]|nr:hypothetical protein [Eubacteriales bacterium]MDD3073942.1 hypothetical protein [Eubacteriales bacterium]MDD4079743.1 hypothetical protein [Eubacteriales bacterium]MDD4769324.1 hypothetical protein [Eubacteriales bacterium]
MNTVYINGKEISNPAARLGIKILVVLAVAAVVALVVPVVGLAVAIALGVALIAVVLALLAVPMAVFLGPLICILLLPLRLLSWIFGGSRRYY